MLIKIQVIEDYQKIVQQDARELAGGVSRAVRRIAEGCKEDLRQDISRLGRRMQNTIRAKHYPQGRDSVNAASIVYTRAPQVIRAFDEGSVIRSSHGLFLAIPTEAAPKRGTGGKRIDPSNFPEHVYGPLRFVYRVGKPSLLVVDNQRQRGGKQAGKYARASKSAVAKGHTATVVMFILIKQVRLPMLLNWAATSARWADRVPQQIVRELNDGD